MLKPLPKSGFSLIELIIGMAIIGVLLSLAMPSFSGWISNTKIRTTAESVQNGLQIARAEAVRRNTTVRFQFVDFLTAACALNVAGPHWIISLDDAVGLCDVQPTADLPVADQLPPRTLQSRSGTDGADANTILASSESSVLFNGLGRAILPANVPEMTVNISNPTAGTCTATGGKVRCLRVTLSVGGQIRMCDPALPTTDAQGC